MKKEEVLALLLKNLKKAIPEFAQEDLDVNKSYENLGVTSLELVELVAKTSKEMGVKLSPSALASVKNTDDLAEALVALQAK